MDIEIREARSHNMPAVAGLRWSWVVVDQGGEPVLSRAEFVQGYVDWATANRATHRCWVALARDEIVGMAWLAIYPRVPSPRSPHRRTGDVQSVYVVPEMRGQGIGRSLLDVLLAEAASADVERVTVHSSETAVPLYMRAGFASTTRLMDVAFGS